MRLAEPLQEFPELCAQHKATLCAVQLWVCRESGCIPQSGYFDKKTAEPLDFGVSDFQTTQLCLCFLPALSRYPISISHFLRNSATSLSISPPTRAAKIVGKVRGHPSFIASGKSRFSSWLGTRESTWKIDGCLVITQIQNHLLILGGTIYYDIQKTGSRMKGPCLTIRPGFIKSNVWKSSTWTHGLFRTDETTFIWKTWAGPKNWGVEETRRSSEEPSFILPWSFESWQSCGFSW